MAFDSFWALWVNERPTELQFDNYFGFPVRLNIGDLK
jgi:hypothetical protein